MAPVLTKTERSCPVCGNAEFAELIDFGMVPQSGVFLADAQDPFPKIHLAFEYCLFCALVRRRPYDPFRRDYRDVNRSTQDQMPAYASVIISDLNQFVHDRSGLVLEIGGNDGAFMNLVAESGYQNRLIVEPSTSLAENCRQRSHPVENVYFNFSEAKRIRRCYGPAGVVFCRHTLEHVTDPEDFFRALNRAVSDGGLLCIETPAADGVTGNMLVHELWDEHLFYFSERHLSHMAGRFGFDIQRIDMKRHRGGYNLLLWARKAKRKMKIRLPSAKTGLEDCRLFKERWLQLKQGLNKALINWPRPIGCMGASHPQSNYAIFTGLGAHIDFLADDDPDKISTFVPLPQPISVISTEQLLNGKPVGTLILTAFGCEDWIEKIRRPLSERGTNLIDPYSFTGTV